MSLKIGHHCFEASLAISARYAGSRTEAASAKQSVLNPDMTVFADSDWAGDRPTRKSVSSWVIMLDGFLIIVATAATGEAKYLQALFLACGQHVNIHLRSDSSGALGVASRRGLQRLRHLDVRFLWLQAETASKNIRISKVPGPENVADANTKPADKRSLVFCRSKMGVTEIPKQFRDAVL